AKPCTEALAPPRVPSSRGRRSAGGALRFLRRMTAKPVPFARGNLEARLLLQADQARDAGDWPAATRHYREVLDLNPSNPLIWVQYGHALKETGKLDEAERAYRNSLDAQEDVADTHLQLGHVLKLQGRKI